MANTGREFRARAHSIDDRLGMIKNGNLLPDQIDALWGDNPSDDGQQNLQQYLNGCGETPSTSGNASARLSVASSNDSNNKSTIDESYFSTEEVTRVRKEKYTEQQPLKEFTAHDAGASATGGAQRLSFSSAASNSRRGSLNPPNALQQRNTSNRDNQLPSPAPPKAIRNRSQSTPSGAMSRGSNLSERPSAIKRRITDVHKGLKDRLREQFPSAEPASPIREETSPVDSPEGDKTPNRSVGALGAQPSSSPSSNGIPAPEAAGHDSDEEVDLPPERRYSLPGSGSHGQRFDASTTHDHSDESSDDDDSIAGMDPLPPRLNDRLAMMSKASDAEGSDAEDDEDDEENDSKKETVDSEDESTTSPRADGMHRTSLPDGASLDDSMQDAMANPDLPDPEPDLGGMDDDMDDQPAPGVTTRRSSLKRQRSPNRASKRPKKRRKNRNRSSEEWGKGYDATIAEYGQKQLENGGDREWNAANPRRSTRCTFGQKPLAHWRGEKNEIWRHKGEITAGVVRDDDGKPKVSKGYGDEKHHERIMQDVLNGGFEDPSYLVAHQVKHQKKKRKQGRRSRVKRMPQEDDSDAQKLKEQIKELKAKLKTAEKTIKQGKKSAKKEQSRLTKQIQMMQKRTKGKRDFWMKALVEELDVGNLRDPFNETDERKIDGSIWVSIKNHAEGEPSEKKSCIAKSRSQVPCREFKAQQVGPDEEPPSPERTMKGGKALEEEDFSSGFLKLPPLGKKYSEAPQMTEVFYVMGCEREALRVHIQGHELKMCTGDVFYVPPANEYWLENKSEDTEVQVFFVLIKNSPLASSDAEDSECEDDDLVAPAPRPRRLSSEGRKPKAKGVKGRDRSRKNTKSTNASKASKASKKKPNNKKKRKSTKKKQANKKRPKSKQGARKKNSKSRTRANKKRGTL